jgi:predicted enzyme related to lactoylglutathione lyase
MLGDARAMAKIVGLGGVFFKAKDPEALRGWYRDVLGLEIQDWGGALLWNEPAPAKTYAVFAVFEDTTQYLRPSERPFMINFRVDDLDAMLAVVGERGGRVLDRRDESADGRFGYVVDPEGTLLELCQPPPPPPPSYVPATSPSNAR